MYLKTKCRNSHKNKSEDFCKQDITKYIYHVEINK